MSSPPVPFAWDDVQLFLALFRARTMREAARTLGVNTSTVSRRLVALEEALDTTLFDRGRDGLSPTQSAHDLLPAAELTESGVARFGRVADALEREVTGLVRVACPPDMAELILLPVIATLTARHPGLRIVLQAGIATKNLDRREADLAVRTVRPTRGDLIARRLVTTRWVAAGAHDLVATLHETTPLSSLPWIGWDHGGHDLAASRWLRVHTGDDPVLRTDDLRTQIAAARAGLGLAMLPGPTARGHDLQQLDVARWSEEAASALPEDDVFLVTHRTLRRVPRIDAVWSALTEHPGFEG